MDQIHGLGAGVSMAASGAHSIQGGNWRIFKEMLDESKAGVYLNTTVSSSLPFLVPELMSR
jgi:prenylcysteine oxidase/farnesylcysteine lyase